jgi:large subunit ribosomal protein L32
MLPCQRKTRAQSRMRRSHNALRSIQSVVCPNCRTPKLPHAACAKCGYVRPGLKLKVAKEE